MPSLTYRDTHAPLVLIVPGLDGSGPGHWRSLVEANPGAVRWVDFGDTAQPYRNSWVNHLGAAIHQSERPVILVAHGLACHAIAWWVALERPQFGAKIAGAVLIAPPNIDAGISDIRLAGFGPTPKVMMPFPLIVVADKTDLAVDFFHAQMLAKFWGGACVDADELDDLDSRTAPHDWTYGRSLAKTVLGAVHGIAVARRPRATVAEDLAMPTAIPTGV